MLGRVIMRSALESFCVGRGERNIMTSASKRTISVKESASFWAKWMFVFVIL